MADDTPRIGLLGGTFDPVHLGHLNLVDQLQQRGHIGRTIFLPAAIPPHKRHLAITAGEHRLAMLHLAIADRPDWTVSDYELRQGGICYTIDTAAHFAALYGPQVRLIVGMDSLRDLHLWYRAHDLVRDYRLLIYCRPGYPRPSHAELAQRFGGDLADRLAAGMVDAKPSAISATVIRERVRHGHDAAELLPPPVWRYIQTNRLYT